MDTSDLDFNIFANHPEHSVDLDYRGIRIKIYKNGDQYDKGSIVVICRKRFKHWLTFLDFLTKKLGLMAPVHEIYRIDGHRIRHFEEIENGGSYVAVSQRPFLHKPYGLLSKDREKWNINSKIESPEQSALDSAESVDIYLKQRGYASRTGLPFPFDGGVCVNHSLIDFGRNRHSSYNLSAHQHHNAQESESDTSKNDAKQNDSRKEQQKSNSESECHLNSIPAIRNVDHRSSIPKVENKPPLHEAGTMNDHNIEQNYENLSMIEPANSVTNKTGEDGLCSDIIISNDRKPTVTVKKSDEFITVPVVQIPDISRDAKNMRSFGTMQTTNLNDYPLPTRNTKTVIAVVNDDALVRRSNSSVIIVNISTEQNKHDDINNVNKSADGVESAPLIANKVTDAEVPSENLEMKTASLSDGTRTVDWMDCMKDDVTTATAEARTPMATSIDCSPSATTIDRFPSRSFNIKDERSKIAFLMKDEDDQYNGESAKINSTINSDDVLLRRSFKAQAENFVETKLKKNLKQKIDLENTQSDKLDCDALKNNAELNEVFSNVKKPTSLSVQRNEVENISDSFEYNKEDDIGKNQSNHISIARGLKCRIQEDQSEDERPATCAISNSDKVHESLTTDKSLPNRKPIALTTPHVITSAFISSAVDTDMKLKMESKKVEIFSDSEGKLRFSPQQMAIDNNSVDISAMTTTTSAITTAVITNTITSNTTDITHNTAISKNVIMHTAIREKEVPNPQKRYNSGSHASFEADFTPRHGSLEKNSTNMKTVQKSRIDLDLNVDICESPTRSSYDPDFKDYDFIQ